VVGSQSAGSSAGFSRRTLPALPRPGCRPRPGRRRWCSWTWRAVRRRRIALGKADLLEPGQRPAAVGVEVALLLGQGLVQHLVDQRQRGAHRKRLAFGVEHLGVAGIDRHAGADGGLGQVHRRDVAALQVGEGLRQLGLERGDEFAAGGGGGVGGALAADEDDAGGEGVGAEPIMRLPSSVRIGQVPLWRKPASMTAARKVSQPVLVVPSAHRSPPA
jgi:hypothetical protein